MLDISIENLVFAVCTLVGGGLLLVTVLVDDILGAVIDFDLGGVSLMPLLLSFVSMFGVGGLFATQVLELHGGQAGLIGGLFGLGGFGIAYGLFSLLRRSEGPPAFSTRDLVGSEAFVAVGIPASRHGSVYVKAEGQTHEFSATAATDIPAGTMVRVTGVAGSGLIVEPIASASAAEPPAAPPASTAEGADHAG
jgi:membrane protein implicated in regulation of membrane protease activity